MASVIRGRFIFRASSVLRDVSVFQKYRNVPLASINNCILCQNFHTSHILYKKRKTEEERALENLGRRVIRYTPKSKSSSQVIDIWRNITVLELAKALGKDIDHVLECMVFVDNSVSYTKGSSIIDNPQVVKDVVKISGHRFRLVPRPDSVESTEKKDKDATRNPPAPEEQLRPRPPVVTVMGHVDHGKTTLLDSLRNTSVVDQEFGGITQHIGAFSVKLASGELVTFLDTPGHAAFSAMRARGANATDMVILVVAADDGVMEQTIESIRMAKEAQVPIIVAINKIDKPGADIDVTKQMLSQHGILVEDLGGDVQAVPVSALKGTNLDSLVEAIVLQAQLMELKAAPTGPVEGVVVEAQTDPTRGKLATVIVQRGTLRRGSIVVAGLGWAKARTMFSEAGAPVSEAPPATPVQLLGWRELPSAGDEMIEVESERRAHEVIRFRQARCMHEKQEQDMKVITVKEVEHQAVYRAMLEKKRLMGRFRVRPTGPRQKLYTESSEPALHIVVKGDVDGSVEAILDVMDTYDDHENCKLDIVHYGVGNVNETDVEMAEAFNGIIYAFNVQCPKNIEQLVKQKNISLKAHNIIYKMVDDIKSELNIRIPISQEAHIVGEANVLQSFMINEGRKKSYVAGSRCVRGMLKKNLLYRLMREGEIIFEGKLESMRQLKNEVDTIKKDVECGLKLSDSSIEVMPGDTIVCYEMVDVKHDTNWNPPGF